MRALHKTHFRMTALLTVLVGTLLCSAPRKTEAGLTRDDLPGVAELKKGDYERAIQLLSARLATNASDADAQKYLLKAYLETGRYAQIETSARKFLTRNPQAGAVRHYLGEVLARTGRYVEAITEFDRAARDLSNAKAPPFESLESDLRRGEVLETLGQMEKAQEVYESLVRHFEAVDPETAPELAVIARAHTRLERYKEANDLYMAAVDADGSHIEAQLGGGELFTEKYNYAEASEFLSDALEINPNSARAHLAVAENKRLEGGAEMVTALERALEINPSLVEAHVLKAAIELEAGDYQKASRAIDAALKVNPNSLEARSMRAAQLYLQDTDFQVETNAVRGINPRYGSFYDTLSHFATITRRTHQAADFSRRAVELSPRLWRAHLSLGLSLLRLGRMAEGREEVEKSFAGDPFNVWAKNTLDLLDTMGEYRETRHDSFLIKASPAESDVLAPYAADLLAEAAAKLTKKYKFTPQGQTVVELFQNHEDFAVRALGLPGLGALGVCFGPVIAQDSPSARASGDFNWGSTLWHEYAHVITLQMTDYRVPRWFSEGLSVYEERRARPGWGDDWNPMVLRALSDGKWFKIADLDGGFMRPRRAEDVPIAYFEASQICEFIDERYGFDAILRMLSMYRDKARTPEVLREVLRLSEDEFDKAFMEYIDRKARSFVPAIASPPSSASQLNKDAVVSLLSARETFQLHLRAGAIYAAEGDVKKAVHHFERANELFPYYAGPGNAYEALADIFEKQGDVAAAARALELLIKVDETNIAALQRLAVLRLKQNDTSRGLEALQLSFYINPFEPGGHTRAGDIYLEQNDGKQALREFRVALALQPPNAAEANLNVARAYHALGNSAEAKRSVLRALEIAPSYEKAQELLLTITGQ